MLHQRDTELKKYSAPAETVVGVADPRGGIVYFIEVLALPLMATPSASISRLGIREWLPFVSFLRPGYTMGIDVPVVVGEGGSLQSSRVGVALRRRGHMLIV